MTRMYKVIGADGKEYGPASAEEVREWIRLGRANAQTQAQLEGESVWRPLGGLPEFAEVLSSHSRAMPPLVGTGLPEVDEILARDYQLAIGHCYSRGWGLTKRHFWLTVGAATLAFLLQIVVEFVPFVGWMATTVLSMVLWGGVDWMFLKLARGQPASFGDVFSGFSRAFVPLMIFGVITMVLAQIGLLLCLAPGIYVMAIWSLFPALLIMDKGMDFWPAMELSRRMVHKHLWEVIALVVVSLLIFLGGLLLVGIGVFLTLTISTAAVVYAYEDIFGDRSTPKTAGSS